MGYDIMILKQETIKRTRSNAQNRMVEAKMVCNDKKPWWNIVNVGTVCTNFSSISFSFSDTFNFLNLLFLNSLSGNSCMILLIREEQYEGHAWYTGQWLYLHAMLSCSRAPLCVYVCTYVKMCVKIVKMVTTRLNSTPILYEQYIF